MRTPALETERILLRPPEISDAEEIFKNWAADPDVTEYLRWEVHESAEFTANWLAFEEKRIDSENSYQWVFVCKETGDIFGSGGISYNEKHGMFEIGYALMKKYWGRGFATEAAGAIVSFAVKTLGQTQIFAMRATENAASGRVLEKLGFSYLNDGSYSSFDGKRVFAAKRYIFTAGIRVRKAEKGDIDALIRLRLDFLQDENGGAEPENIEEIRRNLSEYFSAHIPDESFIAAIAEESGEIVSTAFLSIVERPPRKTASYLVGTVYNVFTYPKHRRKGIATNVMRFLLEEAKGLGIATVDLLATESGKPLYEKLGFQTSKYSPMRIKL